MEKKDPVEDEVSNFPLWKSIAFTVL